MPSPPTTDPEAPSLLADSEPAPANGVRVVLVHPHAIAREGTRRILESEPGFELVGEAPSLVAAVPLIDATTPDVVVLALDPKDVDNRGYVRHLRTLLLNCRVLVLDYGLLPTRLEGLGVTSWVSGTASPLELVAGIRATAEGRPVSGYPTTIGEQEGVPRSGLTPREREVLTLVERGMTTRQIANELRTTPRTVHFHIGNLFTKLGASSRTELVHLARRRGWLE
jgi:DNA-binding NarL/FixJ family response regulator